MTARNVAAASTVLYGSAIPVVKFLMTTILESVIPGVKFLITPSSLAAARNVILVYTIQSGIPKDLLLGIRYTCCENLKYCLFGICFICLLTRDLHLDCSVTALEG